jgi:sulfate transport system substrate-binding protein
MPRPLILLTCAVLLIQGVGSAPPSSFGGEVRELVLASYSVPKEAYEKRIIPAFQQDWKQRTGQAIRVRSSYGASGAQARAIIGGFDADVAALSLEGDLDQIVKVGLITHDWRTSPHRGIITTSVVAFGVRKGNPKAIKTWEDLTKPGLDILYPNPKTSGGAMWDIIAMYGAGLRLGQSNPSGGKPNSDRLTEAYAASLVKRIQKNVKVMDKSGRESVTTFERGIGDVIVTYENELLPRLKAGRPYEVIMPAETVLVENPVAIVDRNVDKHRVRDLAEAFIAFLHGAEAQRAFAELGFRPVGDTGPERGAPSLTFSRPTDLFTIADLGGWDRVSSHLFGPTGLWTKAVEELAQGQ